MRNGNIVQPFSCKLSLICSYPTYEEWKRVFTDELIQKQMDCSYPTYEEWKPKRYEYNEEKQAQVLILPMRNGNF